MCRRIIILSFAWLLLSSLAAQNLIPNPSFETRTSCPTGISQFNGYVSGWVAANTASPDYSGCGYNGNGVIMYGPYTGTSALGTWGGAAHPSCTGTAYVEPVRIALTTNILSGQSYTASFAARIDGVGTASANPNGCVDVGMYFYNSASPPTMPGWCCGSTNAQFRVNGASVLRGPYTVFSANFTAAANFNMVQVGAFCNTMTSSCTNYNGSRMYFNVDDVSVVPTVILSADALPLRGAALPAMNALEWEFPMDHGYHEFRLERSLDGQLFQAIHQSGLSGPGVFQHHDPRQGSHPHYYRLAARNADGEWNWSEVIRLSLTDIALEGRHRLVFTEDVQAETITLYMGDLEEGAYLLQVMDMQGRQVASHAITHSAGGNHEFSTIPYAHGTYVLRLWRMGAPEMKVGKWVH